MSTWLERWEPENPEFWNAEGKKHAGRTMWVTTFGLILSFATWFVMSAVIVKLPGIGFKFDTMQLFWLAAMPGLAGGTFRFIHTFLIPLYGTRVVIMTSAFLKLIPMVWLAVAVQNPETPYIQFLMISFLCGLGGGDFSSFMPSTSLHFPKRLQGYAMGLQAGIGNFGVSLTQFVTPWIISFSLFGALGGESQNLTKLDAVKEIQVISESGIVSNIIFKDELISKKFNIRKEGNEIKDVSAISPDYSVDIKKDSKGNITDIKILRRSEGNLWLQNASLWYIPLLIIAGFMSWYYLRSIKIPKPSLGGMLRNMTNTKHAWFCVITYIMTFGSFSGLAAAFPIMIKTIYGGFEGAPDPLMYAFLGPLIGSLVRVLMGIPSDKFGGSVWLMVSGIGLILGSLTLIFGGLLTPDSIDKFPMFVYTMLFIFLMSGIGNAATFRQYPIIFAFSPLQGAQILGWTGAWAAYGPFIFSMLIGSSITKFGNAKPFFWGALIFYVVATFINWQYYTRRGAERFDWGTKWGTWWDKAMHSWDQPLKQEN